MGAFGGDDITGVDEDVPGGGIVVDLAEEVLQVVELAVDVSDEEYAGGMVRGWEVEGDGLDVLAEIRLHKEVREERPRGDAGAEEVEEEGCEDGEGGHGVDRRVGCVEACASHGRYKYGWLSAPTLSVSNRGRG